MLFRTFMARGFAAVGSMMLVVVLGRLYGSVGVGVYALAMSLIEGAATISRFGMNGAVMRFVGRDLSSPSVPVYLRLITFRSLLFSTLFSVAIFLTRSLWADWFHSQQLGPMLVWFALATPAFTVAFVFAGFMKAVRKPATACLLQNGIISIIAAVLIGANQLLWHPKGLIVIGIAYAIAAWIVAVEGAWHCWHWFRHAYAPTTGHEPIARIDYKAFRTSSSSFFVSDLSKLVTRVVSVWVAGIFLPTAEVGLFKAASQIANLVRFILTVINAILPPRFATLYHQGKHKALEQLARRGVHLGLAFAVVPCALCILAPGFVLGLVGKDFMRAQLLLQTLAAAQLINIACGSVGNLLNMSGHEALTRNVTFVCEACCVALIVALAPTIGIFGVALAVALNIVAKNFVYVYLTWTQLHVWILPGRGLINKLCPRLAF